MILDAAEQAELEALVKDAHTVADQLRQLGVNHLPAFSRIRQRLLAWQQTAEVKRP